MERKFTMNLTWHNCHLYPPKEVYNDDLYITDGEFVWKATYSLYGGWRAESSKLQPDTLYMYWWADLKQTINKEDKFSLFSSEEETS